MIKNIVLIGFMGAGKSVAAQELKKRLNRKVVSTDAAIEAQEGRPITDIFRDSGEEYFRRLERDCVVKLSEQSNLIMDCGGGIFLDPQNILQLKKSGIVFYLSASPETIEARTKGTKHRPLLNTADSKSVIVELLAKRKPYYEQADYVIDTDHKTNEQVCDEIEDIIP